MVEALEVADVVELWVWATGNAITISALEGHIETGIPEDAINTGGDDVDPFEFLAQQVFDELVSRTFSFAGYPFECNGYRVKYIGQAPHAPPYIFCLLLSYLPAIEIAGEQRARQFETLAMQAALGFFGGSAVRIGFPWEKATYVELLETVLPLLPNLGQVALPEPVTGGDRGWDIILVKGFADDSFPKLVALGNCATGRHNWKEKGLETQPDFFWECFQHQRPGTYLTFSAVPFRMDDNSRRRKASDSNMTFDRRRICECAQTLTADAEAWVVQQYTNASNVPLDKSV